MAGCFVGTVAAQDTDWAGTLRRAEQTKTSGHYLEAVAVFREAAALADRFGPRDPRTWATYNSLAIGYEDAGFPADSIRTYRRAIVMVKAAMGKQNADYAQLVASLGTVYLGHGDIGPARSMLHEGLQIETRLSNPNQVEIAMMQSRLAEALVSYHRYAEADRMIGLALPVLERAGETLEAANTRNNLGLVRRWQRRYDESLELIGQSVAMLEKTFGSGHPLLLRALNSLAVVYTLTGRTEEAGATYRRAMAICEKSLPPGHPSRAALLANYARFLRGTGEKAQAKALEEEARSLASDNARRDGLGMTVDVSAFQQR